MIQLYVSKYARAESARVEYFIYEEKSLEEESKENKEKEEQA